MGLRDRFRSGVRGHAVVVGHPTYPDASKVERSGRAKVPVEMRLRVHVDGREPYEVAHRGRVPRDKCPVSGQTLPVSVDADDPQAVRVDWGAAPTLAEQAQVIIEASRPPDPPVPGGGP